MKWILMNRLTAPNQTASTINSAVCGVGLCLLFATKSVDAQPRQVPRNIEAHRDVAYVADGHVRQRLDLFLPRDRSKSVPVIVWIHGGGWRGGSKNNCPPLRLGFVQRGYAVASLGYRLSGDARFPAQIEDCRSAIRWLREHAGRYRIDPDRFGAWGSSAGGHLAALVGTTGDLKQFEEAKPAEEQSSAVQAVCDFFGPTDFLQMDAHAPADAPFKHDSANSPESLLFGKAIQTIPKQVQSANPVHYLTADDPPFLIVHGKRDRLVPVHQSELLHDALTRQGVPVELIVLPEAGHGGRAFQNEETTGRVIKFFDRWLQSHSSD